LLNNFSDQGRRTKTTGVPFTDLAAMAADVWPEIAEEYQQTVLSGNYVGGPAVGSFERLWASYCGAGHAVGVGNGTDALELALTGLGIRPGDEVVIPANTFVATAEAVCRVGAIPRFADVDKETLLMTAATLENAMTPRTRATIVVHLYGQMPDMHALLAAADKNGILLIEDAAQAHGAEWDGRRAGSFGAAACFSFYPAKNLGAFGDAGAVVTSDHELAERVRGLANHGRAHGSSHYEHSEVGRNSRLDSLQATVLAGKLRFLNDWNARRVERAAEYVECLRETGTVRVVSTAERARNVYHLFVVRVKNRDFVRQELLLRNIETGIHYPLPCHRQTPFRGFASDGMPESELAATEVLSLPLFPHMTSAQVDEVCGNLLDIVRAASGS
jgi:dTDP-4-amino-4,6-dideoxygalactose transaminase